MPIVDDQGNEINSIKNRTSLLNAAATGATELKQVVEELKAFLKNLNSQNEMWNKLKNRLEKEEPVFIQKIQVAFVYYYVRYLKKAYFRDLDSLNNKNVAKKFIENIEKELTSDNYKYFSYLLGQSETTENNSPFQGTKLAANFIASTIKLKSDSLNLKDMSTDISNMGIEDFYTDIANIKDDNEKMLDIMKERLTSKEAEKNFIIDLIQIVRSLEKTNSVFKIDLKDTDTELGKTFTEIDVSKRKEKIKDLVREYNNKVFDKKVTDEFINKLCEIGKKEDIKKEDTNRVANTSLEDKLALNIADYITGRITASEFQKKDQEIRKNEENDNLQTLEETKPGSIF